MFHIIDDWVIVPDKWCWMLARYKGIRTDKNGKEERVLESCSYHVSVEKALNAMTDICVREACGNVREGELKDLLITISSECKRLSQAVSDALSWARENQS